METTGQILTEPHPGMPRWFTLLAWLLPVAVFSQFLSAGLGLFSNPDLLGLHAGMGFATSVPVIGPFAGALLVPRLRASALWAAAALGFYLVQIGLAADAAPLPLSFHPANGALLLSASLVLLAKMERQRWRNG